ncbi:MAG: ORF6N domain-containing protein [Elusimicrobiota bacterium]|jgi:hypothetical protein
MKDLITDGFVERRIHIIRGEKVMLDRDLATLYGVPVKSLNLAVKRNAFRFPADFMFRLTMAEHAALRFQFETLKRGEHSKYPPHAFTELGVAMLSSVLNSRQAVLVNIAIMRVFQKLRRLLAEHKELAALVNEHEHRLDAHDKDIADLIESIPQLPPPAEPKPVIGFTPPSKRKRTEAPGAKKV